MQGVVPGQTKTGRGLGDWLGRYPGAIQLVVAAILGLVVFPSLAAALKRYDVLIGNRVSAVDTVWLVVAIVLCGVCLWARASLSATLGQTVRGLIAGTPARQPTALRSRATSVDLPALGLAIGSGVFDLMLLLVIQGIIRVPLVDVVSAYQPRAVVDGAFVVLVFVIALVILVGLYRAGKPLTEYLVAVGLDRLIPTAGFAAGDLPEVAPTRTMTRPPSPARGAVPEGEPTVAAGGRSGAAEAPTLAAGATLVAAASAATLVAPSGGEATVLAPAATPTRQDAAASPPIVGTDEPTLPESGGAPSDATRVAPVDSNEASTAPATVQAASEVSEKDSERTVLPDETLAGDATLPPSR